LTDAPLHPEDRAVLDLAEAGHDWLRALLCTLARRGVQFRVASPERARSLLDSLSTSSAYRAGQFLFDLLELEDFMVDGKPPATIPTALDARALHRIAGALRHLRSVLDGAASPPDVRAVAAAGAAHAEAEPLPELEPGFHLYADVVLGALRSAAPLVAERRADAS